MTLLEIKTAIASYFGKTLSDLTINSQDLGLLALNQARRQAELAHDFEFTRRLVTLTVNGVTGGSLSSAVLYGTQTTVSVKRVIEVGMFDDYANLRPVEWTTVAESLERQRQDVGYLIPRFPTDGWARSGPNGLGRFSFTGDTVFRFPKDDQNNYAIGMEVYTLTDDWDQDSLYSGEVSVTGTLNPNVVGDYTIQGEFAGGPLFFSLGAGSSTPIYFIIFDGINTWKVYSGATFGSPDHWSKTGGASEWAGTYTPQGAYSGTLTVTDNSDSLTSVWTQQGSDYLIWQSIVYLNHRFKEFVGRTEGNLPPPTALAAQALEDMKNWDAYRYDASRRHGRV